MLEFDAMLFPSDGRAPHLVKLVTSPMLGPDPHSLNSQQPRMPHPEVHMDYIAELGSRAWKYHVCNVQWTEICPFWLNTARGSPRWYESELHKPIRHFLSHHLAWRDAILHQQGHPRNPRTELQRILCLEGKHRCRQVSRESLLVVSAMLDARWSLFMFSKKFDLAHDGRLCNPQKLLTNSRRTLGKFTMYLLSDRSSILLRPSSSKYN